MKKIFAIIASLVLLLMVSIGCNNRTQQAKDPPIETSTGNPFQSDDNAMGILGSISHGPTEQNFDENKNRNPFIFDGDEVTLEYFINASGMAKNVGFLVFVNGVPQPYKIDDTNAPYEYVHIFNLKEDNADLPFMFIFSPVTGKKGDVLDMNVVSIYNPAFMPDMEKTTSYGGYQTILPSTYQLEFKENAPNGNILPTQPIGIAKQSQEAVTSKLMQELSQNGMRDIGAELLNKEIFSLMYFDDVIQMDNLKVKSGGNLHVTYKLCGHPGLEYTTTFYANHKPIAGNEGISYETTLSKGQVSVIELDIALEKLAEFTTFYAISVPKNANDYPDGIFEPQKTLSILLYKGE